MGHGNRENRSCKLLYPVDFACVRGFHRSVHARVAMYVSIRIEQSEWEVMLKRTKRGTNVHGTSLKLVAIRDEISSRIDCQGAGRRVDRSYATRPSLNRTECIINSNPFEQPDSIDFPNLFETMASVGLFVVSYRFSTWVL